jgi:hypothetical protein
MLEKTEDVNCTKAYVKIIRLLNGFFNGYHTCILTF